MIGTLSALINTVFQLFIFLIIPFIWWLLTSRKKTNFLEWIGLKRPIIEDKRRLLFVVIITLGIIPVVQLLVLAPFLNTSDLATSAFEGTGFSMFVPILLYAFIQTGLAEEIFFRGFLGKRFSANFGFAIGNSMQAILFGLLHGVIFFQVAGALGATMITIIIFIDGWLLGFMNEKLAVGSIIPSWLIHGLTNLLVSLLSAFNILY